MLYDRLEGTDACCILCATRVVSPLQLDTLGIAALSTALEGMAKLQTLNMSCNSIEAEAMVR